MAMDLIATGRVRVDDFVTHRLPLERASEGFQMVAAATESVKPGFFKMNMPYNFGFVQAVIYTLGVAVGYGFALLCFTALRERLDVAPTLRSLKGAPMSFIAAGLLSLGYIGLGSLFGL